MSYKVRIEPSGHEFTAESCESLLHAGLRAGLNLECRCANGSCGHCMVRILQGDFELIRQPDFRLTPRQRAERQVLPCCVLVRSDMVIEARESRDAAGMPQQRLTARVARVDSLNERVRELHLRTPRSQTLQFLAGQRVTLHLEGVGRQELHLASCPCDGMNLKFHIPENPHQAFSRALFAGLGKGKRVEVEGPEGEFLLDEASRRPLIFIAWETGFAAVESLIEHAIALQMSQPMRLYWLASVESGRYLTNYCRSWQDALDEFHYQELDVAPDALARQLETIIAQQSEAAACDYYLILPEEQSASVIKVLQEAGLEGCSRLEWLAED
jgi:CDP-4-dehydro-6-deoxyglucose reductase